MTRGAGTIFRRPRVESFSGKERKVGRFGVPVGDVGIAPSANERTFDGIIGTKRRDSGVDFVFVGWVLEEENERDCRRTTVSVIDGEIGVVREEFETGE